MEPVQVPTAPAFCSAIRTMLAWADAGQTPTFGLCVRPRYGAIQRSTLVGWERLPAGTLPTGGMWYQLQTLGFPELPGSRHQLAPETLWNAISRFGPLLCISRWRIDEASFVLDDGTVMVEKAWGLVVVGMRRGAKPNGEDDRVRVLNPAADREPRTLSFFDFVRGVTDSVYGNGVRYYDSACAALHRA